MGAKKGGASPLLAAHRHYTATANVSTESGLGHLIVLRPGTAHTFPPFCPLYLRFFGSWQLEQFPPLHSPPDWPYALNQATSKPSTDGIADDLRNDESFSALPDLLSFVRKLPLATAPNPRIPSTAATLRRLVCNAYNPFALTAWLRRPLLFVAL
ncbi:hypothetical protein G6O67_003077 [Ophiocordyceps sinensis]|uniref:Uncharacterized protein n=1 Tax=Ophiocordyceps sinensis TaxID=72228 RepID=A0A8H4V884_9HYPO|nr:hypothetical protein G6O67_003077 [Ophiocordyceps sinensis]